MKRLSPQLVVSVRRLVMEKTSRRHRGCPEARMGSPDVTLSHAGPTPATLRTHPHVEWISIRPSLLSPGSLATTSKRDGIKSIPSKQLARGRGDRRCAETSRTPLVSSAIGPVIRHRQGPAARTPHETPHGFRIANSSPYFSSSLTLSFRGAVSPARHVLTRPRPHPFSRQRGERTSGPFHAGEQQGPPRAGDAECAVEVSLNTGTRTITEDGGCDAKSRHGRQPWPQSWGVDPQDSTTFPIAPHRGNPEDAPGCSVAEQRSQSQRPSGRGFSDLWIA